MLAGMGSSPGSVKTCAYIGSYLAPSLVSIIEGEKRSTLLTVVEILAHKETLAAWLAEEREELNGSAGQAQGCKVNHDGAWCQSC